MKIEWKYKIELEDENVFSEIAKERSIYFPEDLKKFIIDTNAAEPDRYKYMAGNVEKVFGAVLSFNKNEADVDSVFTAFDIITDKSLVPFAIDPFGNYICYSLKDGSIIFWNHETNEIIHVSDSLTKFLDSLY